jgi:hypothetical protein
VDPPHNTRRNHSDKPLSDKDALWAQGLQENALGAMMLGGKPYFPFHDILDPGLPGPVGAQ